MKGYSKGGVKIKKDSKKGTLSLGTLCLTDYLPAEREYDILYFILAPRVLRKRKLDRMCPCFIAIFAMARSWMASLVESKMVMVSGPARFFFPISTSPNIPTLSASPCLLVRLLDRSERSGRVVNKNLRPPE